MSRRISIAIVVIAGIGLLGFGAWTVLLKPSGLPPGGFAPGNGRIEADLIDIAPRLAGRVAQIAVREGDLVAAGDVLAVMDTAELRAQLARADAAVASARAAVEVAAAHVSEASARLALAQSEQSRAETLSERDVVSRQNLDIRRSETQVAEAGLAAARATQTAQERAVEAEAAARAEIVARIADATLQAGGPGAGALPPRPARRDRRQRRQDPDAGQTGRRLHGVLFARDMATVELLDINPAHALVRGTTMPLGITIGSVANVRAVTAPFDIAPGGDGRFADTPIAHMVRGAGVPPPRFACERRIIKEAAIRQGLAVMIASAPQAGATSPVALTGSVAQVTAEALAGSVHADAVRPGCPPAAAVAQIGWHLGLPTSVPAGMTDAKLADAQSGAGKALNIALAGHAGASMVHEAAGMHASLMGCSLESLAIDNDMPGNVPRAIRGIDTGGDALSLSVIRDVDIGDAGHYPGAAQTLELMETEYVCPPLSDRQTTTEWERAGSRSILERARAYVDKVLAEHRPDHISPETDRKMRAAFDIRLPVRGR